jgi:hypothetical protein
VSELPWNPYPQQDWRQLGGQPPYQGEPYRTAEDQLAPPEPDDGHEPPGPPPPRRNRHMVRNIIGAVGILAVAGLVVSALSSKGTGASSAGSHASTPAAASVGAGQPTAATASAAAQPTGPGAIGSSFTVQDGSGDSYQVTLVRVIDPAKSADQFVTPDRGSRLVGIVFRITALTGSPQGEDADNDCTVVGNDGKVYTAVFDSIVGYTNFEVGVIHTAQGATVTGAVTFELPQYTTVVAVRWVASDGLGTSVMWDVAS